MQRPLRYRAGTNTMKWYVLTSLLVLSFGCGWAVSTFTQKPAKTTTAQVQTQTQSVATSNFGAPSEPVDIYSGIGMSPDALYDTLNGLSGVDFDKRYINYVILMQADLTGINRLAKEKAVAPTLKDRATELWGLDSQRLTDLYALQKALGYTHH